MTIDNPDSNTTDSNTSYSNTRVHDAAETCATILDAIETVVVGKRPQLQLVLSGLLAGGHVLLEDLPGLGKTLIARSLAQVTGLTIGRVQFTPDLMPADVTGSLLFNQQSHDFTFRQGPIFHNVIIADEINRAPPEDPGVAARGNAGTPGHRRRCIASIAAAVSRLGDPEPDRVRGHLSTARGPDRSVLTYAPRSVIRVQQTMPKSFVAGWRVVPTRSRSRQLLTKHRCCKSRQRWKMSWCPTRSSTTALRWCMPPEPAAKCMLGPAHVVSRHW